MAVRNCTDTTNVYESMTWCPGSTRTPGIRKRVYFITKKDIASWPTVSGGKYTGNFTLVSGKYFNYMDLVVNDSKFSAESQGDYPCKTFRQKGEFFYPGLEDDITDFETKVINDDVVFLVQQSSGAFKVLGCEEFPTNTNVSSDSGSSATDKIGVTITPECDAPTDLLIYSGSILTGADEDANPSAGS